MKKFAETLMRLKSMASLIFTGQIMVFAAVYGLTGYREAIALSSVWQALAIAVITALLQYVCYSETIIKKMRYVVRTLLFSIPLLLVLASFAYAFEWFPIRQPVAWVCFVAAYLAVLGIVAGAFEAYYRITGKKYTAVLKSYRLNHPE